MTWNEDWTRSAACRDAGPDFLFVRGAEQNRAKQMCANCPVRSECLAEALDNQIEWGVWGGMTERERRALLRRRPNVTSWRSLLEVAQSRPAQSRPAEGRPAEGRPARSGPARSRPAPEVVAAG